jgi:ammonium transporter, Amt family
LSGNPKLLLVQLFAVAVCGLYTMAVTYILYKLVDVFMKVRISVKDELMGLDLTQHRERAYTLVE